MSLPSQSARLSAQALETGGLRLRARLLIALAAGAVLSAGVAAVSPGLFWNGWLAAAFLLVPVLFALLSAWQWGSRAGGARLLAWLVALAFLLRLAGGIGLSLALPVWGYAEEEQQAGYLFKDAYYRDTQAWDLARSGKPLWASFRDEFSTDQYGGLLALSALIYRYLSPDAHRPALILILGSFFAALGVPFLWRAARLRWNERVAALAAWITVLYPDAIYFASSQMREPFLVGLSAVGLWAVLAWDLRKKSTWLALIASLLGMALISSRVAVAIGGFLGILFLLEHGVSHADRRWRVLGLVGLGLGILFVLAFSWEWFRISAGWDMLVTNRASGSLNQQIKNANANDLGTAVILLIYGVARPFLPAAITETTIALARIIGVLRSLGWYALAPFLVYGLFSVWREADSCKRRRILWLALTVGLWIIIASARGGGDGTDNPRYRSLFILWMALLAAWAVDWALTHHDAWLWRWISVEAIFLGFFTHWYLGRYTNLWLKMPFWQMIAWIVGLSGLVLVGGWAWDRWRIHRLAKGTAVSGGRGVV